MNTHLTKSTARPTTRGGGHPLVHDKPSYSTKPSQHLGAGDGLIQGDHELDHYNRPVEHLNAPPLPGAAGLTHMQRGGRESSFLSSDESALTKQILSTHAPDIEDIDVKPVLSIVEEILHLARPSTTNTSIGKQLETLEVKKVLTGAPSYDGRTIPSIIDNDLVNVLAYPISRISCEIICKCSAGGEAHATTMDLLKSLTSFSWDAKIAITFAAFAINYGEFWLVERFQSKNSLAKNIATLKDLPHVMENAGELKKKFEAVLDLLTSILNVAHCVIAFKELPPMYISHESPEITKATAHIPIAVYWIIRSLLACASILLNLIGSGHEYITTTSESWEILSFNHKLSVILEHLKRELANCSSLVDKKKAEESYQAFRRLIESSHIDNMRVLKAMIRSKDDQKPLYDGSRRINERIESLRLKYVLLLISDLQIPQEEVNVLHMIYNQRTMKHEYEVLWLPIVDPTTQITTSQENVFYDLRNNNMPWYSVDHPSLVDPVAIRYIREAWEFTHMPMLVVLDPQGKPSNLNALPMMWIWGGNAFPFTKYKESALWAENNWNIELLADSIDPRVTDWIRENRVICLYGGEDIDWIRKFTLSARAAAGVLHVPLEMLYVGKRNPKDKVRRCHEIINREKLSHIFSPTDYYDYVWYFWVRLWSMWNSKKHMGMAVDNDRIMQEIMDILTFDSSDHGGWAVFSRGNHEMTKGKGEIILPVLENYNSWRNKVDYPDKFVTVLDEEIRRSQTEHHCNRLILPGEAGYIPDRVVCSECGKTMEKYVMYRCCTD